MKRANRGFTLLELVMTLAILAVLITLVAPSFQNMILNSRQTSANNEIIRAIHVARSEAAKRAVTLNLSAIDASSSSNEWGKGWRLWEDKDGNGNYTSANDDEIMAYTNVPDGITIDSNSSTARIKFSPTGHITMLDASSNEVSNTSEYFKICDSRTGETGKKITFTAVGQPTTTSISCP